MLLCISTTLREVLLFRAPSNAVQTLGCRSMRSLCLLYHIMVEGSCLELARTLWLYYLFIYFWKHQGSLEKANTALVFLSDLILSALTTWIHYQQEWCLRYRQPQEQCGILSSCLGNVNWTAWPWWKRRHPSKNFACVIGPFFFVMLFRVSSDHIALSSINVCWLYLINVFWYAVTCPMTISWRAG